MGLRQNGILLPQLGPDELQGSLVRRVNPLWVRLDVPDKLGEFQRVIPICFAHAAIGSNEHQLTCYQTPSPIPLPCSDSLGNLFDWNIADGSLNPLCIPF